MHRVIRRCLLAPISVALLLGGCGDAASSRDDPSMSAISHAVNAALTSTDAAQCRFTTTRFQEKVSHPDPGQTPLAACQEDADAAFNWLPDAEQVALRDFTIEGNEARVAAVLSGGSEDGSVFKLRLLDLRGWKVDAIESVTIDRARFIAGQHRF
jgi:hypothetical protein